MMNVENSTEKNDNNGQMNNLNVNNYRNNSHSKVPSALSNLESSRLKNNLPFGNGYSSNYSSGSNNSSDIDENNSEKTDTTQNSNINTKTRFGSSSKGGVADIATKIIKDKKKLKILALLAPTVGTAILWLLIIVLIAAAVMVPIMFLGEEIEGGIAAAREFGDKFTNLVSGSGFKDSSQLVPDAINKSKKKYESYKDKCLARRQYFFAAGKPYSQESDDDFNDRINAIGGCIQGDFDEGILISTLQVNNTVDYSVYDEDSEEDGGDSSLSSTNSSGSQSNSYAEVRDDSFDKTTVDTDEVGSFYTYADKALLGKDDAGLINVKDKGLIYNLLDYRFTWQCGKTGDVLNNIGEYMITSKNVLNQFASDMGIDTSDPINAIAKLLPGASGVSSAASLGTIIDYIKTLKGFKEQGLDFNQYLVDQLGYSTSSPYTDKNVGVIRALWNSDSGIECGEGYTKFPVLIKYINYDNYVNYLKEVYIPTRYFNCKGCQEKNWTDEAKDQITRDTIIEILNQRNAYYELNGNGDHIYLVVDGHGDYHVEGATGSYYGGTYPVGTKGTGWKQYDPHWSEIWLGNSSSTRMGSIGCFVTSIAMVMANSGTKILGTNFDPGVLATVIKAHGGFTSGGSLSGSGWATSWHSIAPNFNWEGKVLCGSSSSTCGNKISELLGQGKSIVVEVPHHFIAVVGADSNGIIISDPATKTATDYLSKYNGQIYSLRVFNKTD